MKRLLLPLLAAIALPTAVNAGVDSEVHNLCKDVSDYIGCVKANSSNKNWNIFNKKKVSDDYKELNIYGFKYAQLTDGTGRYFVLKILKGSPAYKAGLKYGDEITQVNGEILDNKPMPKLRGLDKPTINLKVKRYFRIENREFPGEIVEEFNLVKEKFKVSNNEFNNFINQNQEKGLEQWVKFYRTIYPEYLVHKGQKYFASEACPINKNMIWSFNGFRGKNVQELGCMTQDELKLVNIEFEMKKMKRAIRTNALSGAANSINNLFQQQQINTNMYNSNFGY